MSVPEGKKPEDMTLELAVEMLNEKAGTKGKKGKKAVVSKASKKIKPSPMTKNVVAKKSTKVLKSKGKVQTKSA